MLPAYGDHLASIDATPSTSGTGKYDDNVPIESFFHTLNVELVHQCRWPTQAEARQVPYGYIEEHYDRHRMHSALEYLTPEQAEQSMTQRVRRAGKIKSSADRVSDTVLRGETMRWCAELSMARAASKHTARMLAISARKQESLAGHPSNRTGEANMITIYGSPGSRAARCLWALEEMDLRYEQKGIETDIGVGPSAEYLALNRSGKVPLLVDDGVSISESYAINLYLAHRYGRGGLWPDARAEQAASLQWSFWVATETEPNIAALFAQHFQMSEADRSAEAIARANANMAKSLGFLDAALAERPYLNGDRFSVADLNVAAGLRNSARLKVDLSAHRHAAAWLASCLGRPSHVRVLNLQTAGS